MTHPVVFAYEAWGRTRPLIAFSASVVQACPVVITPFTTIALLERAKTELAANFEPECAESASRIRYRPQVWYQAVRDAGSVWYSQGRSVGPSRNAGLYCPRSRFRGGLAEKSSTKRRFSVYRRDVGFRPSQGHKPRYWTVSRMRLCAPSVMSAVAE
ncbi:hypothetical protein BD413DRAFT_555526 [Trametes elegans]|nr:hypothetical protein BD413DRAFT_555526 [Trametes elegans]